MKIKLTNLNQFNNIIFFDIEYDQNSLVQLAFLILGRVEPNIFEVQKSVNLYLKQNHLLTPFFVKYTNITDAFLRDNGIDLAGARTLVNEALFDVEINKSLLISHGVKNDVAFLASSGIGLSDIPNHYCTYNNAKRLLKRYDKLTLKDVAAEGCYYCFDEHNAYADVWATLYAFSRLNGLEDAEKIRKANKSKNNNNNKNKK